MTLAFVKKFNRETRCSACTAARAIVGKRIFSLCDQHLNEAAEKFRCWYNQRKAIGKCSQCNRKAVKDTGRCKVHTKMNKVKCAAWMAANKQDHYARQAVKKEAFLAAGLCICREHNELAPQRRRCKKCLKRRNGYKRVRRGRPTRYIRVE